MNDECEIIGEFLLDIEKDKTYFDLTNEKNQAFIEKIKLENELQQALKVQRRGIKNLDSSLRMKIAWSLCPKTSMVASQNAMQDGYLAQIFEKLDNDEKLTPKEEVVLKNYYKSVWNCAGTEEFSKACIEASKIMHQLKTEGIESIEDPQILKVINDFYDELENQ